MKTVLRVLSVLAVLTVSGAAFGAARHDYCKGKKEFDSCGKRTITGLAPAGQCIKSINHGKLVCRRAGEFCHLKAKKGTMTNVISRGRWTQGSTGHLVCRAKVKTAKSGRTILPAV